MLERLLHRDLADGLDRPGAKWPSRSGQDNTAHILAPARAQRLEDRVVLGIDRQDRGAGGRRPPHEQRAGADQTFLIGKRHRRAALGGGERRLEAGRTGDRSHHPIGGSLRRLDDSRSTGSSLDAGAGKLGFEFAVSVGIGDGGKARAEFARQARQSRGIAVRGHRLNAIAGGILPQQIHRARPDRAGGAQ